MMRRKLKSNSEFPLTKTTGEIARNRRFLKPSETSKAKRVRFDDAETDASSRGHEATQSPKCGSAKTSEYAYFRKVKDGAVNGRFRALHKENKQLKSPKVNYIRTETYKTSEKLDASIEGLNFTISGESAGPSGLQHFVSPAVRKYDESYEIRRKVSIDAELTHKNKTRSPLLTEAVTPIRQSLFSSPGDHPTEKSENQCIKKGVFSEKRERLCHWVAHTTSCEVEKLRGKGSDLVSLLLSRLIPKGNENNDSSKGDADDSNKSLIIHETNNVEKEIPLSRKIDCKKDLSKLSSERSSEIILREWERFDSVFPPTYLKEGDLPLSHETDCHVDLSKSCDERSSETIAREWESFDSGLPSNYLKDGYLRNKSMDHSGRTSEIVLGARKNFDKGCDLQNKAMDPDQSFGTRHYFSFCLPFESFRSFSPFHFKDLGEFGPIIGHGRDEPNIHSLEWGFGVGKERVDHGTRKDVCHSLANAWSADQKIIVDNIFNNKEFSPPPLVSSRYIFNPLPNYVSTGYLMHEAEPNLDDLEYAIVEPRHLSLTIPSSPECIPLAEDENAENILSNSNIIFSYREPRFPKMVWDCKPRSEFLWKCLPAPELSADDHPSGFHAWQFPQSENGQYSLPLLKEAHAEPGTSFCDGAFDHCLLSSTPHSPVDAFMNCPLLLDHVSHDILDQELYFDDYDNELGYT